MLLYNHRGLYNNTFLNITGSNYTLYISVALYAAYISSIDSILHRAFILSFFSTFAKVSGSTVTHSFDVTVKAARSLNWVSKDRKHLLHDSCSNVPIDRSVHASQRGNFFTSRAFAARPVVRHRVMATVPD